MNVVFFSDNTKGSTFEQPVEASSYIACTNGSLAVNGTAGTYLS